MMRTLLITDASLGRASAFIAGKAAQSAAEKCGLVLTASLQDAELVIVAGKTVPADHALSGKNCGRANCSHC